MDQRKIIVGRCLFQCADLLVLLGLQELMAKMERQQLQVLVQLELLDHKDLPVHKVQLVLPVHKVQLDLLVHLVLEVEVLVLLVQQVQQVQQAQLVHKDQKEIRGLLLQFSQLT